MMVIAPPQSETSPVVASPATVKPAGRILFVDDEPLIRLLSMRMLVRYGFEVTDAEDGASAWESLQIQSFDLLITDNQMPKVTGFELIRKVHGARMALPVIMVTALPPKEEFARSPWLQPAATLIKPFTPAQLLLTVRNVLSSNHAGPGRMAPPAADGWSLL
jgi:two-component system chemotaxis response regulator CheY